MRKKAVWFLVALLVALLSCEAYAAQARKETKDVYYRELKVLVGGKPVKFDVEPFAVEPGWIMCQLEPVVEKMGWVAKWDDATSTLEIVETDEEADNTRYRKDVRRNKEYWHQELMETVSLIEEHRVDPSDRTKAQLLDSLDRLLLECQIMLTIQPSPKYATVHNHLVLALRETKSAIRDLEFWVNESDEESWEDGMEHLERKSLHLETYEKEIALMP